MHCPSLRSGSSAFAAPLHSLRCLFFQDFLYCKDLCMTLQHMHLARVIKAAAPASAELCSNFEMTVMLSTFQALLLSDQARCCIFQNLVLQITSPTMSTLIAPQSTDQASRLSALHQPCHMHRCTSCLQLRPDLRICFAACKHVLHGIGHLCLSHLISIITTAMWSRLSNCVRLITPQ